MGSQESAGSNRRKTQLVHAAFATKLPDRIPLSGLRATRPDDWRNVIGDAALTSTMSDVALSSLDLINGRLLEIRKVNPTSIPAPDPGSIPGRPSPPDPEEIQRVIDEIMQLPPGEKREVWETAECRYRDVTVLECMREVCVDIEDPMSVTFEVLHASDAAQSTCQLARTGDSTYDLRINLPGSVEGRVESYQLVLGSTLDVVSSLTVRGVRAETTIVNGRWVANGMSGSAAADVTADVGLFRYPAGIDSSLVPVLGLQDLSVGASDDIAFGDYLPIGGRLQFPRASDDPLAVQFNPGEQIMVNLRLRIDLNAIGELSSTTIFLEGLRVIFVLDYDACHTEVAFSKEVGEFMASLP